MQTLIEKFDSTQVSIISICTIGSKMFAENYVKSAMLGRSVTFPVLMNGLQVQKAFKGRGVPNTFIIDRGGRIRYKHRGFSDGMKKYIELEIQSLLQTV